MYLALPQLAFWIVCLILFWTYFGYYLFLRVYSVIASKSVKRDEITPGVSLIITAYNEKSRIADKIENSLSLDYPNDKIEIIVVSDGSNDGTTEIISRHAENGIKLIDIPERIGKHNAQERGVKQAGSEIIIFTDAATQLETDAVRKIVRSFSDPGIGCVSGMDRIDVSGQPSQGEGIYIKYEMGLRTLESHVSSLIGVSGSFFAVRREICESWYRHLSSDFYMPIVAYMKGYRSVLDREAIGSYSVKIETEKEFKRKVRTVVHGLDVVFNFRRILNPFKYGFFSIQMISHKLLRWLAPFFLILCLILNLTLAGAGLLYQIILAFQILSCLAAAAALAIRGLEHNRLFRIPSFFAMVNLSILVAWLKFIVGERYITWERTER
jgi:cellulose synthase/poly-beta-1,6-N-acetylglucosamine synthase-like glycosyltransferase